MNNSFDIVILGLSITSSWGNGHATTWRSLVKGLASRGHRILFLERNMPWYASNRDDAQPYGATTILYETLDELFAAHEEIIRNAPLVLVGSYVPDGIQIGQWVTSTAAGRTAFYDIDTPITLSNLRDDTSAYITRELIPQYDAYLSFTGGPVLPQLENEYGSPMARALYCSVDSVAYNPRPLALRWDLGYLGTYSADRQAKLNSLLLVPAESSKALSFVVAGPQYPEHLCWPVNVERIGHLPPADHPAFYSSQRFTLNVTREAMRQAGYSPSVRLFEAAACGVPIISDWWDGLDSIFPIGTEVLVAEDEADCLRFLTQVTETERQRIAAAARATVLNNHTSAARAAQLEDYWKEMNDNPSPHSTRRHRCSRQSSGGINSGLESERFGPPASERALP